MKKGILFTILLSSFVLCACNNDIQNSGLNEESNNIINSDSEAESNNIAHEIDSTEEEKLNLVDYSVEYDQKTDSQVYFPEHEIAGTSHGYYFWNSNMLMFLDATSRKLVPLCNKPNCTHARGIGCNARFNESTGVQYDTSEIWYYGDHLYLLGLTTDGYTAIYKLAIDGSSIEEYYRLFKKDNSGEIGEDGTVTYEWRYPDVLIHRDYVYYIDKEEKEHKIRRISLNSGETELVYETKAERSMLYRVKAYGDYIFFQSGYYEDESYDTLKAGIMAYNTITGEVSLVKKGAVSVYDVYKDTLYYSVENAIREYSLVTQEDKVFAEGCGENADCLIDKQYVYTYYFGVLQVYTHDGDMVCEVIDNNLFPYFFAYGDSNILFCELKASNGVIGTIDIADFADSKAEWTYYYWD